MPRDPDEVRAEEAEFERRRAAILDAYQVVSSTPAGKIVLANLRSKAQESGLEAGERAGRGAMILHWLEMLDRGEAR